MSGNELKVEDQKPKGEVDAQVITFETDFAGSSSVEHIALGIEKTRSRASGTEQVQKDSNQQHSKELTVGNWVEPRMSFADMLDFYDINVWHKRSVLLKAAVICGLGWKLTTENENKEEDQAHARIMQLLEHPNPNPEENFTELCMRMMIDNEALGNGFIESTRNLKGEIVELYHARAATVRRDKGLRNGGYWQGININQNTIGSRRTHFANFGSAFRTPGENELLHYYTYDPKSDYYGIPDWYPALADMLMDRNVVEYYITLFKNQLMAKFAIIVEGGKLSEKALKSVKNFITNKYSGIENAGGTMYLNSEQDGVTIKIEKLQVDFGKDKDGKNNLRNQSRDIVIGAHGVPPRMVGVMSSGQLGGGGEVSGQLKSWKENDINPRQGRLESFLNNTVIASFGEHKWKLKFNEMDVTDLQVDSEYWEKALDPQKGWATRAEAREDQGLPPEEEEPNQMVSVLKNLPEIHRQITALRKSLEIADGYDLDL